MHRMDVGLTLAQITVEPRIDLFQGQSSFTGPVWWFHVSSREGRLVSFKFRAEGSGLGFGV